MFLELMKAVNWFNPLIYLLQRSLRILHEYIADEQTAAIEKDALTYSSFLLNNAYGLQGSPLTHSFFNYNLLKKRIIMLNQKRSGRLARLKYLASVPLCAAMLCASTLVFSKDYGVIDLAPTTTPGIPATEERHSGIAIVPLKTIKADTQNLVPPPPPVYVKNAYRHLQGYLYNNVEYPEEALKKKINGSVILSYDIGSDQKINNVSVIKSTWHGFDNALIKAMQDFNFNVNEKPGKKTIEINFMITGTYLTYISDNKLRHDPAFAGNIVITDKAPDTKAVKFPPPVVKPDGTVVPIKNNKRPLPPALLKSVKNSSVSIVPDTPVIVPPVAGQINSMLPPPPPYNAVYKDLIIYVSKHTRYPTIAHDNKINGHVLLTMAINNKHQITDVKVEKGIGYGCDEEAARALKTYTGVVNKAPGIYKLVVTFMSINNDKTKFYTPGPLAQNIIDKPDFIGQAIITTYTN